MLTSVNRGASDRLHEKSPQWYNERVKDGRIYRRLAAYARCCGYRRVTRHAVHDWVKQGLLPHVERHYEGFGPPAISMPTWTGALLLEICRLRYDQEIGRLRLIVPQLWLHGHPMSVDAVRTSLTASIRARPPRTALTPATREAERAGVAARIAHHRPVVDATRTLSPATRALLVDEFIEVADGTGSFSRFGQRALRSLGAEGLAEAEVPKRSDEAVLETIRASDDEYFEARVVWGATVRPVASNAPGTARFKVRLNVATFLACLLAVHQRRGMADASM